MKKWDLSQLIPPPGSKEYDLLLQDLEKEVCYFESFRSKLSSFTQKDLLALLKSKEKMTQIINRLYAYAHLGFSTDTSSSDARALVSKMEDLAANNANRTLFFTIWFKELDDKKAGELIKGTPEYKYLLERIRQFKPYSLNEEEEKIINLKDISGSNLISKLYDMLTSTFKFELLIEGKKKSIAREELTMYVRSSDPKLREAAYKELLRVYAQNGQILGELYVAKVTDWKNEYLVLRGYKTPQESRNRANDIPNEAYQALLKTVKKNNQLFQEYLKLKFKACGVKDFSRYHIYAPYESKEKKIPYEAGIKMVLENFEKFYPPMAAYANNLVVKDHIDSPIREGKKGGAYCYYIAPGITPFVFLNYASTMRDVFTLAHELGHAVHGQLADKQSILMYDPPIPLCETASIFSEMLLFDKLMETEKDKEVKKGLIIQKLDDLYASIARQANINFFEEEAHKMIASGAGVNELAEKYLNMLQEHFGEVEVPSEFKWEWTYIPHIYHTPFYCYGYSFGNLLTLALYEKYKEEGNSFIPKYLKILEYGGSENPEKILKEVGIDITSEAFWQSGFDLIKEMIEQLEVLK